MATTKSKINLSQVNSDTSTSSSDDIPTPLQKIETKTIINNDTTSNSVPHKKSKSSISICLTNCRYDIIRKISNKFGFKEVSDSENWNMYWTDLSITVDRCKEMKRFQKINHFPGMLEICRKDLLARNLNRMLRLFPRDFNIFPRTWCLPADLGEALTYNRLRKNKTFILKPDASSQGRGIFVTKSLKDIKPYDRGICQVYLNKPFLIDGFKFDLRIYTLITSCDPLRIYIYNEGLVRFATCKYKEPNPSNITNVFMHLTNYAVNKYSRTYNQDSIEGSKRRLSWFKDYIKKSGYDANKIFNQIDDIIIKTVISACPILKHSYAACFPNHDVIPACCELLGVDIIFDKRLNPLILEVNHSPSFHTDTNLDFEIKESLLTDMFNMLNLKHCDKRKIIREDKKRVRERLLHGIKTNCNQHENICFEDYFKHEIEHCGDFRMIYPTNTSKHVYAKYFDQGLNSLYTDTAASRAREAAQNAYRDEMNQKAKLEAAKIVRKIEPPPKILPKISAPLPSQGNFQSLSFEPEIIDESEEKERLQRLAQRDYLVRSHGILELIYFAMKKNGHLRPHDERKFAIFSKLRSAREKIFGKETEVAISDLVESITQKNNNDKWGFKSSVFINNYQMTK